MRHAVRQPDAGPGQNEWSLIAIQRLLWNRRWLILAVVAEVAIITFVVTVLQTPLYEASVRLVIERSAPKVLQGEEVLPTVWNELEIQRFYQTQYLLLKDPALLRRALDRHGVREGLLNALATSGDGGPGEARTPDDNQLCRSIAERLKIQQVEYSNLVKVSFRHARPEVAANVVNAIAEEYRDQFISSGLDVRKDVSQFLKRAIEEASADVKELEARLGEERRRFTAALPVAGAELGKTRLDGIDAELTTSKTRLAKAEARLGAALATSAAGLEDVRSSPQVLRFREDLAGVKRELAEMEGRVGESWPRLRELRTAVAELEHNIEREQQRVYQQTLQAARAEVERERKSVERLTNLLDQELLQSADAQLQNTTYEGLRQEYEQKRQALDRLLARREEVAVSAELRKVVERQVSILELSRPPERPATPRVKFNVMLGLAFGLLLGVVAAFVAESADNKIRSGAQLAELTHLPLLGSIPRLEGQPRPRLIVARRRTVAPPVLAARRHDVEEAFRALRSALLLAQPGAPPGSLLVTSALPGEGKSTVAANLGRTLASFGHRTALIDADLRHPRLHRVFCQEKPTRGLTNVLASSTPLVDVLLETPYDNLHLVPGGPSPPDPATLLDPQRFREMLTELSAQGFQFVIVDTPPLMVFADCYNIVPVVEGVILVARALVAPKDAVRQTLEGLRKVNAPLLGAVLNGEVSEERSGSYYRYYHYRRGYYRRARDARGGEASQSAETGGSAPDAEELARR